MLGILVRTGKYPGLYICLFLRNGGNMYKTLCGCAQERVIDLHLVHKNFLMNASRFVHARYLIWGIARNKEYYARRKAAVVDLWKRDYWQSYSTTMTLNCCLSGKYRQGDEGKINPLPYLTCDGFPQAVEHIIENLLWQEEIVDSIKYLNSISRQIPWDKTSMYLSRIIIKP